MMMETPAKRLRILQSVEVDETNPEYIEAKQKQQQRFKSKLERIFDKYGSMHESMSDEIDFTTGKVVVDRGHIRRIQRQLTRKGPTLVDNFLGPALEEDSNLREDEEQSGSEDELAPVQTLKRKRDSVEVSKDSVEAGKGSAQSSVQQNTMSAATPQALPTALSQNRVPNTPNPAASLLEGIQFPQTPFGQQAQALFVANLNQTIAQAVQQVVAPLLSILQNTPNAQALQAQHPIPALQTSPIDAVRPTADPKWYFPPMTAAVETPQIEPPRSSPPVAETAPLPHINNANTSSPLVTRRQSPKVRIQKPAATLKRKRSSRILETSLERRHSSTSFPAFRSDASSCPASRPTINKTDRGCTIKESKAGQKYHFTEEDDAHISQSRGLHSMSFRDIQRSRAKWSEWPLSAFCNRWHNHLKDKRHPRQTTPKCLPTSAECEDHFFSSKEIPETSSAEHHLPTPSSLEQEVNSSERNVVPSSSHFDDDDLELLSLAGADVSDVHHMRIFDDEEDIYPTPDEPLPSIEGADFRNEEELQEEMLKLEDSLPSELPQSETLPSTIPETQESAVVASPPSQKHEKLEQVERKPVAPYRASTDSSDDLNLIGTNNELATPCAYIKRESITPQATSILRSPPVLKTPRPIPQSSGMAKSTGKLNRRAFLNDVKKGWAKGNGRTPSSQKRRSLNVLPRATKGAMVDVKAADSEDELAV